jgi:hypothetical protein
MQFTIEDRLPVKSFLRPLLGDIFKYGQLLITLYQHPTKSYSYYSKDLPILIKFSNNPIYGSAYIRIKFIDIKCYFCSMENINVLFYRCLNILEEKYAKYWRNRGALKPMRIHPLYQLVENTLMAAHHYYSKDWYNKPKTKLNPSSRYRKMNEICTWNNYKISIYGLFEKCEIYIELISEGTTIFRGKGCIKNIIRGIMRNMDNGSAPITFYSNFKGSKSAKKFEL